MCTLETQGNIFILTLTGDTEHRLNPPLIAQIRSLLCEIKSKSESQPGSILITTGEGKFFSNGFDLAWASSNGSSNFRSRLHEMVNDFKLLVADLVSLALPTIACITGHAAAAGFMLAISHDYIVMKKSRGVLYMSEIDLGMTFPDYFMDLMREKLNSSKNLRNVCLQGMKIKAEDGIKMGIVDEAYDSGEECMEACLKIAEKLGLRKWNGEVYSEIRKNSLKGLLPVLGLVDREVIVAKL
ncbi:hypothetical protein AQUCO_03900090v1 [Aquilegia coerulea]|uniref:Delta(3)-Delta(2)-enoyl-CoA isomerase n=1 Tax=Aquilegia coerulea TaxID=218851 RepID=A0A2G5CS09_AQUCA|nr:hypothetical protein AQUCO_03900090v1 [Aquilegia coerulea]